MCKYRMHLVVAIMLLCFVGLCAQAPEWNWARAMGNEGMDYADGVATDNLGNIYVTGVFSNTMYIGDYILNCAGVQDIFVIKYDRDGNLIWAKRAGGPGIDQGQAICVDEFQNVYITGEFEFTASFGYHNLSATGGSDVFVAKLNLDGVWMWATRAGGQYFDEGACINLDYENNVLVGGIYNSSAQFGSTLLSGYGASDIFVGKLSYNGQWIWAKTAGGNTTDKCYDITSDDMGNTYITGDYNNSAQFGPFTITTYCRQAYVAKLSSAGTWIFALRVGTNGDENRGCGLAVDSSQNIYITGQMTGIPSFGSTTFTCSAEDILIAKLGPTGEVIWAKKAGGPGNDCGYDIKLVNDNQIVIAGRFSENASFGPYSFTSRGMFDNYLCILDSEGNWLDATKGGGVGNDYCRRVSVCNANSYVICGFFNNTASYGSNELNGFGDEDVMLASVKLPLIKPVISPQGGEYAEPIQISMSSISRDCSIYYTLDGQTPTTESQLYIAPFTIDTDVTVKAFSHQDGALDSAISTSHFEIYDVLPQPSVTPPAGVYPYPIVVTIFPPHPNAEIYFTTDGSEPSMISSMYYTPFLIASTTTLKVKAYMQGMQPSITMSEEYEITGTVATPEFSVPSGLVQTNQPISLTCSTIGAEIRYTTDGSNPLSTSQLYTTPLYLTSPTTIRAIAFKENWTPSAIVSASYQTPVSIDDEINAARIDDVEIYPNPFSTSTTIVTSSKAIGLPYSLMIYNIKGECIYSKTGISESKNSFIWDGIDSANKRTASGIYIVKFNNGKAALTRKLIRL